MKPDCKDLERAMREPDGELAQDFRSHLAECPACREEMGLWLEISEAAPSLRKEWDSPGLWPRILAELREVPGDAAAGRVAPREPARAATVLTGWGAWAAGLLLAALSASVLWVSLGPAPDGPVRTPRRNPLLTERALQEVERAEAAYVESIERLSALAEPKLADAPTPLRINYREKLRLIDQAIQDLRANLEGNRFNAHARAGLLSVYREKRNVLEELLEDREQ